MLSLPEREEQVQRFADVLFRETAATEAEHITLPSEVFSRVPILRKSPIRLSQLELRQLSLSKSVTSGHLFHAGLCYFMEGLLLQFSKHSLDFSPVP